MDVSGADDGHLDVMLLHLGPQTVEEGLGRVFGGRVCKGRWPERQVSEGRGRIRSLSQRRPAWALDRRRGVRSPALVWFRENTVHDTLTYRYTHTQHDTAHMVKREPLGMYRKGAWVFFVLFLQGLSVKVI